MPGHRPLAALATRHNHLKVPGCPVSTVLCQCPCYMLRSRITWTRDGRREPCVSSWYITTHTHPHTSSNLRGRNSMVGDGAVVPPHPLALAHAPSPQGAWDTHTLSPLPGGFVNANMVTGGGATKKASRTNQGWAPGPTLRVNVRIVVFTGWVRTPRAVTVHDHWWTRRGWGNGTLGPHPCCLPLPLTRHVGLGREAAKSARHT